MSHSYPHYTCARIPCTAGPSVCSERVRINVFRHTTSKGYIWGTIFDWRYAHYVSHRSFHWPRLLRSRWVLPRPPQFFLFTTRCCFVLCQCASQNNWHSFIHPIQLARLAIVG